ncbi:MAG: DUF3592 domain-containing protein [Oscillospiraceae bacterium]|nr:DUF3592 domain-containing protein [Oscillospiraceae bacterium]
MENNKLRKTNLSFGIGGFFAVFGAIMLCFGIWSIIDGINFRKDAGQVTGVISHIESYRDTSLSDSSTKVHDVYVTYTVNGQEYERMLGYYDSSMYAGQEIEIFYNPENPEEIKGKEGAINIVLPLFGLAFLAIGLAFVFSDRQKKKKMEMLLAKGSTAEGIITAINIDHNTTINGRHPLIAEVTVTDPETNEQFLYSSESIMEDIRHLEGRRVMVYYDPDDRSNYYVDIDTAQADDSLGGAPQVHDFR